jgi:hypothetical protein
LIFPLQYISIDDLGADLPLKMPLKAPESPSPFDWSGFYFRRFERWCGFGHCPSDGVHVAKAFSGAVGGPPFFCGALIGPIAILIAPPASESSAGASCGIAIVAAPIAASRNS